MAKLHKSVPVDTKGRSQTNVLAAVGFDDPILVHDSFDESPLGWAASGTGADYSVLRDQNAAYFGAFGCRLKTRATGPAEDDYVIMNRDYAISDRNILKVGDLFRIVNPAAQVKSITLTATHKVSGITGIASIKYAASEGKFYYLNSAGAYVEFLASKLLCGDHWHRFAMRSNTVSGKYGLLTIDATLVDLSAIPILIYPSTGVVDSFNVSFTVIAAGATQVVVDVDNIIVKYSMDG